ncbi:MAG: AI-2E family transporter [Clostridia bacterium]|nr:AI-2E family transporter [Clostridia bacterium]
MKLEENKKYIKIAVTGIAIALGSSICLFAFYRFDEVQAVFHKIFSILRPFLYGAVLAFLLTPMCRELEITFETWLGQGKARKSKHLSILISLVFAITVVSVLGLIVVPQVVRSLVGIVNALPGQLRSLNKQIEELLVDQPDLQEQWEGFSVQVLNEIEIWRNKDLLPLAQTVLSGTATYVTSLLVFIKDILLALVISVYLLATRDQFFAQARLLVRSLFNDVWADRIAGEMHYVTRMFNGFFTGKLLDSLIVGVLCFVGCLIMGFSSPVLISVIIGVTNIIPFFGPFIGAIPCALFLLLSNPVHCLMFIVFILVLQQLDGNVIGPKVLGNTTGLSGFWVTFAILLFGGLWGLTGMIVGVPLFAVIYDIVRRLCYRSLNKKGHQDIIHNYQETFHPKPEAKPKAKAKK